MSNSDTAAVNATIVQSDYGYGEGLHWASGYDTSGIRPQQATAGHSKHQLCTECRKIRFWKLITDPNTLCYACAPMGSVFIEHEPQGRMFAENPAG